MDKRTFLKDAMQSVISKTSKKMTAKGIKHDTANEELKQLIEQEIKKALISEADKIGRVASEMINRWLDETEKRRTRFF